MSAAYFITVVMRRHKHYVTTNLQCSYLQAR